MEILTDANYADDQALLANTTAQTETLLDTLKQASKSIGQYVKSDKTEFMYFKQVCSLLIKWQASKINRQFINLGNNVSSTEHTHRQNMDSY